MKTLFRWLTGIFLFLATALFILTVTVPLLLPPSDHKALLVALVEGQSGRQLTIDGDARLRITPALHLFCTVDKAKLSGNPAFGDTPFVYSEQTSLELSLWRVLLQRRLHINSLTMDNVTITLIRSKNNIGNWQQDIAIPASTPPKAQGEEEMADSGTHAAPPPSAPASPAISRLVAKLNPLLQAICKVERVTLGRFFLNGVNLRHENRLTGDIHLLSNLWIRVGGIRENIPFPFEAGGNFSQENILDAPPVVRGLDLTLQGNGTLTQGPRPILLLEDLRIDGTLKAAPLQKRGLRFSSSAIAEIRPQDQQLSFKEFSVRQGESVLQGTGIIENLTAPHLNFTLTIPECAPQPFLKQLRNPPPIPPHAETLKTFAAEMTIDAQSGITHVSDLTLHLDDSTVTGTIDLHATKEEPSTAALHIDTFDLDRYQHLVSALPQRQFKPRPLQLDLAIDALISQGLAFTQTRLHLSGRNGIFEFSPFSATMQKGSVEINARVNLSGNTPKIESNKKISNIPLSPFLLAATGRDDLSGTATINATVSTQGRNKKELWRQMNGTMEVSLSNGAVNNPRIIETIQQCGSGAEAAPADNKLSFSRLSCTGGISNGILSTANLLLATPTGLIQGTGEIDLNSGFTSLALSLTQSPNSMPTAATKEEGSDPVVPPVCHFNGNLDSLDVEKETEPAAPPVHEEPPAPPEGILFLETPSLQPPTPEVPEEQPVEPVEKVTGD